tara:strand:- start:534 stop:839 length:306 start_codon:yes stop_codon:yes gene_type:complete
MVRVYNASIGDYVELNDTEIDLKEEKLAFAKEKLRNFDLERKKILEKTDKYVLIDYPISEEEKQEVIVFRQKIRDLSKQEDYPDVLIPTKPGCIKEDLEFN